MTEPRRSPLSTALVVLLALAQPAMAVRPYAPLDLSTANPSCHQTAPGQEGGPGQPGAPRSGTECVTCCCVPGSVLASSPLDPAVLLVPGEPESLSDDRIRERPRDPLPRLLPFAIAPPAIV